MLDLRNRNRILEIHAFSTQFYPLLALENPPTDPGRILHPPRGGWRIRPGSVAGFSKPKNHKKVVDFGTFRENRGVYRVAGFSKAENHGNYGFLHF